PPCGPTVAGGVNRKKFRPTCRAPATSFVLGAKGRRQSRQEGSMSCTYPLVVPSHSAAQRSAPASDTALIAATATGDRLALRMLYGRHHVRVYRFLLRLTKNEAMAEALLADVFRDVWRKADRFEGRSQVSTWLLAIARHKALSALRRPITEAFDDD